MGQSKFKWIFVMEDGKTVVVEATFEYLLDEYQSKTEGRAPVAIIRGEFL